MPRGAPEGNQYARKTERRRGISVSYYLKADLYELLKECLDFEAGNPVDEEVVRKRVNALTEQAVQREIRLLFARFQAAHPELSSMDADVSVKMKDAL